MKKKNIDDITEYEIDSIFIQYKSDTSGIITQKTYNNKVDTLIWSNQPFKLVNFYFGDSLHPQLKNYPLELNSSIYYAKDLNARLIYNSKGLFIQKDYFFDIPKDEIINLKKCEVVKREYEFKSNLP